MKSLTGAKETGDAPRLVYQSKYLRCLGPQRQKERIIRELYPNTLIVHIPFLDVRLARICKENCILTIRDLSEFGEERLLKIHHVGSGTVVKARALCECVGLDFPWR